MIIKKFVAKTESDATEEARRELGQGIVIMNVRPVKPEGFLSFMRPPRVEVTVALEDEPIETPTVARPALNRLNADLLSGSGSGADLTCQDTGGTAADPAGGSCSAGIVSADTAAGPLTGSHGIRAAHACHTGGHPAAS